MDIVSFPVRNSSFCSEDRKKGEMVEMNLIDDMISQNELYKNPDFATSACIGFCLALNRALVVLE